ncbi:hypothetical protein [Streptomyces sp. NPDC058695]|uniref:hypothetical protein n=1 Tax=Streptomyces sp. NPDC058695 TaxID=3346604 RepID=UPI0036621BB0
MPAHRAVSRAVALLNLTGICRSPINAVRWERIEPWSAARVYLGSGTHARTLVVKWIEDGPGQTPTAHRRLRTELAALEFLGDDIGTGLAPDCCGAPPSGASATPYPCRAGRRNYCRRHGR